MSFDFTPTPPNVGRRSGDSSDVSKEIAILTALFDARKKDPTLAYHEKYPLGTRFYTRRNAWCKAFDVMKTSNPDTYGGYRVSFHTTDRTKGGRPIHITDSWIIIVADES